MPSLAQYQFLARERLPPIQVTGEATPDYLHHGIMVRFTAQGKGEDATELVHELAIVTAASHKAVSKGSTTSKPTDNAALASATKKQEAGRTVIGQLGQWHDNKWSVIADGKTWQVELADDVKIKAAFTGSHFVSPGDKVVVQGEMIHGESGSCTATGVQVTLAKPLSASKDAKRHKPDSETVLPGNKKA